MAFRRANPQPPAPGRAAARRRLLLLGCSLLLSGLLAEVTARIALARLDGGPTTPRSSHGGSSGQTQSLRDAANAAQVVHPFLGYVTDPTAGSAAAGSPVVGPRGFFELPRDPADGRPTVEVGVFGGSVAFLLAFHAQNELQTALEHSPAFAGTQVRLHCYAMGGYKQPQPFYALAYALLEGDHLDAVIELDGFNEVALTTAENGPRGLPIAYPRNWDRLVAGWSTAAELRQRGLVAYLEEERQTLSARFAASWWRHSALGRLFWRVLDGRLARRLEAAERQAARGGQSHAFLVHGDAPPRPPATSDVLRSAVAIWQRASLAMRDLCAARGIPFLLVLQPNQYDLGSKPLTAAERQRAWRADKPYRAGVELGYPLLRTAAGELAAAGVEVLDLTRIFAHTREPLYVDDCCHVGPRGSRLLVPPIARALGARRTPGAVAQIQLDRDHQPPVGAGSSQPSPDANRPDAAARTSRALARGGPSCARARSR